MNVKAVILLLVVALATSHAEERTLLNKRNLQISDIGKSIGDFSKNVGDLVDGVVSISGSLLDRIKGTVSQTLKTSFKDFDIPTAALDTLAQFGEKSDIATVFTKLQTLGSDTQKNMKRLFQEIGDKVMKVGDKVMTVAGKVNDAVQKECPNIGRAQEQVEKGLESLVKSMNPDNLKKNAKYIKDMSIVNVTDIASQIKGEVKRMASWDEKSFMETFSIPSMEEIKNVGCDGACASECKALKEATDKVWSSMIDAVKVGKDTLKDAFSSEKPIGQQIMSNMKEAKDEAKAHIQLLCSTTESLGSHISKLQQNAQRVIKNYQEKFCSSASSEYIQNSKELMQCLFKNGKAAAIANSPIRKKTKAFGKALEGVSCQQKNGGRLNLGIIRKLKGMKFDLPEDLLKLIKTDMDGLIAKLKDKIKDGFNAAEVTIMNLKEATGSTGRLLSAGNAVADVNVEVKDDSGLTVVPGDIDGIVGVTSEEEPQFAGSDINLQESVDSNVSGASAVPVSAIAIVALVLGRYL